MCTSGQAGGVGVAVGVAVGVSVGVGVAVSVGVAVGVGVSVGVAVGVSVGVAVGVSVGVAVGVSVGVAVGVSVGVAVGVSVGVAVGVSVGVAVAVGVGVASSVHVMLVPVTFAFVTVPAPLVTTQVWPAGCANAVAEYGCPLATAVANVKLVLAAGTDRLSPPLFCSTSPEPVRPVIPPPTV